MTEVRVRPPTKTAKTIPAVASIVTAAFLGSVIVTPLYSLYQEKFGFSEITLTLVYAVYAVGNVTALLLFGRISDNVGRKRVALPALGLAGGSALLFLFAQSTAWLYAGRLTIGLAVGILSGTGTAWLAEQFGPQRRTRATVTAATANLTGIAVGPLLGGLLGQYAPAPLVLPFLVYLVLLAGAAAAVARIPDERQRSGHGTGRLLVRPRIGVPRDRLRSFVTPAVTGFVTFALGGLYFALIPTIVLRDLHLANIAVSGLVVFELGAVAAVCISLGGRLRPASAMVGGLVALLPAVALVVAAQAARSLALLLLGAAVGGIAMALGYRGSLEVVNRLAPGDRRAEVTSLYFVSCFVGNSVPVIGIGVLSTVASPLTATVAFAAMVGALSVAALLWHRRDPAPG
ncbi:MFS transporter [Asanoa sp. NPDC049573]|uniref:MFS transporter n=1 Tax=Asanoa sp. NPDC049573 TaxID=3155396 RepID=UPI00343895F3